MTPGIPACGPEDRGSSLCPAHPYLEKQVSDIRSAVEARQNELLNAIGELRDDITALAQEVHEHHAFHKGREAIEAKAVNWPRFGSDLLKWALICAFSLLAILMLLHAGNVIGLFGGKP